MIRPLTKLNFEATQKAACLKAVKEFQRYCVIIGLSPEHRPTERRYSLDAAHVFPRSTFPELAKCVENILPIIHYRHSWRAGFLHNDDIHCLDLAESTSLGADRTPSERIEWLTRHVHDDLWPKVKPRLIMLVSEGAKVSKGVLSRRDEALEIIGGRE